jgi:hypothetical protein
MFQAKKRWEALGRIEGEQVASDILQGPLARSGES